MSYLFSDKFMSGNNALGKKRGIEGEKMSMFISL